MTIDRNKRNEAALVVTLSFITGMLAHHFLGLLWALCALLPVVLITLFLEVE